MDENIVLSMRREARAKKRLGDDKLMLLHDLAVGEIRRNKATVLGKARFQIAKWEANRLCHQSYIDSWRSILSLPADAMESAMLDDSAQGVALRQNSPFGFLAGFLHESR